MKKPHYAWAICVSCVMLLFVSMGLCSNAFVVYQPFIISEYGFSYTQASLVTTVRTLVSFACVAGVEDAFAYFGLRRTVAIGLGFEIISRLIFAFTSTFPAYCIASVFGGVAYSWAGMVPLSQLITNWFYDRRGLAMGFSVTGSGIASIVMPPILTGIIQSHGIGQAFLAEALLTLLISTLILLLIVERPADRNMQPYCITSDLVEMTALTDSETCESATGLSRRQRLAMITVAVCVAGPAAPGFSHLSVLFITEGYDYNDISWLMSATGIGLLVGKIIVGILYDKLGSRRTNQIVFCALITAMVLCSTVPARAIPITLLIIVLLGIGLTVVSVSMAIWARDLDGETSSAHAMKLYSTGYSFGALAFSPIPGIIADTSGRYVWAYALFALMAIVAMFLLISVYAQCHKTESFISTIHK